MLSVWQCPLYPELCSYYVPSTFLQTDGLQTEQECLRWSGDSQRESGPLARIDSLESIRRKTSIFTTCERFLAPPECDSQKGVEFGKPETIRKNQAIRANLRIDSRESGHLRSVFLKGFLAEISFFSGCASLSAKRAAGMLPQRLRNCQTTLPLAHQNRNRNR